MASANRRIWSNADVAVTKIYDFNIGLFLGRAEDYEELQSLLDQADTAFKQGQTARGFQTTLNLFRQASGLAAKTAGSLAPHPYTSIPSSPNDAKEFIEGAKRAASQYFVDGSGQVSSLAATGDAMEELENGLVAIASLKKQIATIQQCLPLAQDSSSKKKLNVDSTSATSPESNGGYEAQRKGLLDRAEADERGIHACIDAEINCSRSCATQVGFSCDNACNKAEDACTKPLQTDWDAAMQSMYRLDAVAKGRLPK